MGLNYVANSRAYTVTLDQYGVDPLLNKAADLIANITTYRLYDIKQYQRGRPDVISTFLYGDPNYWWVIMFYNGFVSFKEIKEGITIQIPDLSSVTRILADQASLTYGQNIRTVSI